MKTIKIEDALKLKNCIFIDVRTESEYQRRSYIRAFNMPLFKDHEHCEVGTIYKMQGKMKLFKKGLTL